MTDSDHLNFGSLFSDADSNFTRSAGLDDLRASFSNVLITSAIAKCLDFNKYAQKVSSNTPGFFLVANVRAMCEDLIYCSLFRLVGQQTSDELMKKLNHLALLRNVYAQTRFFALNNQLQPTLGSLKDSTEQNAAIEQVSAAVNDVWKRLGLIQAGERRPPSIWRLSRRVGLETTYDYAYHLTSNFVHFNPGQLFRTGWGPMDGPFSFCVDNFKEYFSNLARFLGALVFPRVLPPRLRQVRARRRQSVRRHHSHSTARQLQMAGDHHVRRNEPDLARQHHRAFAHDNSEEG